jgi:hypothetical protein
MPNPRGQQRDKPYRDALRKLGYENDRERLNKAARALWERAQSGDPIANREIADRLDGKVPQAIVGDDDEAPIRHVVTWEKDDD